MSDDGEKRTTGTGDVVGGRKEIQKPPEFQQLMKPDALASRQESASTYRIVLPRNEAHAYETTFIIQGRITSAELQSLLQGGELFTRIQVPDSREGNR
jgi:hypothetical protein